MTKKAYFIKLTTGIWNKEEDHEENNEEQDRDLEAAVNLIKHIRNFYEAIPPVMQQMCTEAILDAAGEMQENGDLKPAMAELEYLPPSLHTGEIDLLLAKIYRQIGSFDNPDHPKFRKRAITIMQRHADEMKRIMIGIFSWGTSTPLPSRMRKHFPI